MDQERIDELTPDDVACLRMLAGANFGPSAELTLPSGRVLTPDEAQAFTSAYAPSWSEFAHSPAPGQARRVGPASKPSSVRVALRRVWSRLRGPFGVNRG